MSSLATRDDYELLIGPVASEDEAKLDYMLAVASSVVAAGAPGLVPYLEEPPPGPVPEPAVLVTCQTAANLMAPSGGGKIERERVGLVETTYATTGDADGLMPNGWRRLLKEWRPPDLASVRLSIPHPTAFGLGYGGEWWWPPGVPDEEPMPQ